MFGGNTVECRNHDGGAVDRWVDIDGWSNVVVMGSDCVGGENNSTCPPNIILNQPQ